MKTNFKNLTAEDQQIMSFTSATNSYLKADRADAGIMRAAQEFPRLGAIVQGPDQDRRIYRVR